MKFLSSIVAAFALCASAHALDFRATLEGVWAHYVGLPRPTPLSEARLRLQLEMAALGGPMPSIARATPYGIELQYWNRVIAAHGLPIVADDYFSFLGRLKAELARNNQQRANTNQP